MGSVEALHRIRMKDTFEWNPSIHEPGEPVQGDMATLATAS
jgi:hypothetical protein